MSRHTETAEQQNVDSAQSAGIPKIIHQIQIGDVNKPFSGKVLEWMNRTKAVNKDYEHRLWSSKQELEAFVAEKYPNILVAYKMLPFDIQRVDLARLLILHEFGGVYVDIDVECLRPFEPLIQNQKVCFSLEPDEHAQDFENYPYMIGTFFIAAEPKNEFIKYLIDGILGGIFENHSTHFPTQIMKSMGPAKITELHRKAQSNFAISLIPSKFLSPLNKSEIDDYLRGKYFSQTEGAFMVHLYAGAWVESSENKLDIELKRELKRRFGV